MPCHSHHEERTIALSYHCDDSEIKTIRHSLVEGSHCIFNPRARVGYEMVDSQRGYLISNKGELNNRFIKNTPKYRKLNKIKTPPGNYAHAYHICKAWCNCPYTMMALKSFCLRDRGTLGNEGWPISLKIGTQSRHVDLCNMPKFQVQRPFFSRVLGISPSGVPRGWFLV